VVAAIPHIVILDDVLDAHIAFLGRLDLLEQLSEVAVCLAAAGVDLVVVVAVPGDEIYNNLKGNEIFPVCAGDGAAVVEHQLGAVVVMAGLLQQVLDRVVLERFDGLGCRRHDLSNGRVWAPGVARPTAAIAVDAICVAVHGAGGGVSRGGNEQLHSIPHSTHWAGGA
jgi:hypothetical protein